jgi:hypothetical protein
MNDLGDRLSPQRLQAVVDLWRAAGRRTEIPVEGRSMYPLLRSGWRLQLDHAQAEHPFGAIIVFIQGRTLVAHRVVGRRRSGSYLTKGDALLHCDRRPVRPDRILGRVVAVRSEERSVSLLVRRQRLLGRMVALVSRSMAILQQATAPLRRMTGAGGRLPGSIPGPTRILGAGNRAVMGVAGRFLSWDQSPAERSEDAGKTERDA